MDQDETHLPFLLAAISRGLKGELGSVSPLPLVLPTGEPMPLVLPTGEPCPKTVPASAQAFLALPIRKLPVTTAALYVSQREAAFCRGNGRTAWLGSGESTTCHIVAFRNPSNGDTFATHIDGSEGQMPSLLKLLERFNTSEPLDVYILGGFLDPKDLSEEITEDLISHLAMFPRPLRLQLICTGPLNDCADGGVHKPKRLAAAIEIASGRFEPVDFEDRGPDLDLRIAQVFGNIPDLLDVWDTAAEELSFGPWQYRVLRNLIICRQLCDTDLLQYFSTSPLAEGPNFCIDLRSAIEFMYNNPEPNDFFRGVARRYQRGADGRWARALPVQQPQAAN